jgi:cytidine deaminase
MARSRKTPARDALVEAAWTARESAQCRYSGFAVGAAIEDEHGAVWTGANVENASWTLGLCAERVAIFYAVTHGAGAFRRIAVVTDTPEPTSPCGACRQILHELAPAAEIVMVTRSRSRTLRVAELLPHAFDDASLARTEPRARKR